MCKLGEHASFFGFILDGTFSATLSNGQTIEMTKGSIVGEMVHDGFMFSFISCCSFRLMTSQFDVFDFNCLFVVALFGRTLFHERSPHPCVVCCMFLSVFVLSLFDFGKTLGVF